MSWKIFAELVELKAKTASVFPFILGVSYAWYHYREVKWWAMGVFFVAMFLFNMAVDILDNYMDYHNATDVHDYREETNIIGRENLSLSLVRRMMIGMIVVSAAIGIVLASQTSWVILVLGIISYSVGIFYSAGPRPLSSLPVGEVASGITMGFIIPLICVYLNVYDRQAFNWSFVGDVFLMSLPAVFAIANLMLANNTCDLEEDELNERYISSLHRKAQCRPTVYLPSFSAFCGGEFLSCHRFSSLDGVRDLVCFSSSINEYLCFSSEAR